MSVLALGLSHKTAPVGLRERLAIPSQDLGRALDRLHAAGELSEVVVLSTCNRVEVYARPRNDIRETGKSIADFFQNLYQNPEVSPALYRYDSLEAVRHLFRVASGLDSMVVGETEVLGQVKSAYQFAQGRGTTGKITNVFFQRALYVGKKVRTKTNISEGSSSVGSIAVQLAERIFGPLENHRILLLGAGEMAEVTARHLLSQKAGEIIILNRTRARAEELAKILNGAAGSMDVLEEELLRADIVVCSASSEKPLITKAAVQQVMKARRGKSLYFIDIAVPRNVEPDVHQIDNTYVYNIDDLKSLVDENIGKRKAEVEQAEVMVNGLAGEFYEWAAAAIEGKSKALRHGALTHEA